MVALFGDDVPEDGWDADDPLIVQLVNLRRRVSHILIHESIGSAMLRRRIELLGDDLAHVLSRLGGGDGG